MSLASSSGTTDMAWTYYQLSGRLEHDGKFAGLGYSGKGAGKNNPLMVSQEGIGPIPTGRYQIGRPFAHPHAEPGTMRLTPKAGTVTWGRSGFMIHGDSRDHPGEASTGCIILKHIHRYQIWNSNDDELEVKP
jgi:hypothetical protein